MALKFTSDQFDTADNLAREAFFEDMRQALYDHHGVFENRDALFETCKTTSETLGLVSERALFAYFDMSFALEVPLAEKPEFLAQTKAHQRQFSDPDRLVLELYDSLD